MDELIHSLEEFVAQRDWQQFHTPKNLAMALSVEVAEIIEHFQWLTPTESQELTPAACDEVADEIGDVQIYLILLSRKLGVDPIQAALRKLEKNQKRFPAEAFRGKHSNER